MLDDTELVLMSLVEIEAAKIAHSPMLSLAFAREQSSTRWVSDLTSLAVGLVIAALGGFAWAWLALG